MVKKAGQGDLIRRIHDRKIVTWCRCRVVAALSNSEQPVFDSMMLVLEVSWHGAPDEMERQLELPLGTPRP